MLAPSAWHLTSYNNFYTTRDHNYMQACVLLPTRRNQPRLDTIQTPPCSPYSKLLGWVRRSRHPILICHLAVREPQVPAYGAPACQVLVDSWIICGVFLSSKTSVANQVRYQTLSIQTKNRHYSNPQSPHLGLLFSPTMTTNSSRPSLRT